MMATTAIKCAIYVRISDDRGGEGLGVRRQELECRELAQRLGWHVVEVYCDNDVSAKDRKKKRKDYARLLADMKAGRIDGIIAWAPDRLHRQMRELVPFIDLVNEHGVAIQTVVGGHVDLSTAIGRMTAKTLGNAAEFESELKQERILSKIAELVRDGKVHNGGNRPFGFTRIYAGEGPRRKILRDEINEEEADLIREAVKRTFAGESTYSICGDWNDRGIKTSTGRAWSQQAMKLMLISGRIAGLKEHRRQVVGEAAWPAIISREDHEALRARLNDPKRYKSTLTSPRRYWLSGLVFCSDCELVMKINHRADNHRLVYRCPPPKMGGCGRSIVYDDLDEMMTALVIRRLNDPQLLRDLAAREATAEEEGQGIVEKIEGDERRLKLLEEQLSTDGDEEELPELIASVRAVRKRIAERRNRLAQLAGAAPLVGMDVSELRNRWADLLPQQKAGLLRAAGIAKVLVKGTTLRGRFDPERVELEQVNASDNA
ncbi:MAG: recombinase family protein [Actinoallomurus sp.]